MGSCGLQNVEFCDPVAPPVPVAPLVPVAPVLPEAPSSSSTEVPPVAAALPVAPVPPVAPELEPPALVLVAPNPDCTNGVPELAADAEVEVAVALAPSVTEAVAEAPDTPRHVMRYVVAVVSLPIVKLPEGPPLTTVELSARVIVHDETPVLVQTRRHEDSFCTSCGSPKSETEALGVVVGWVEGLGFGCFGVNRDCASPSSWRKTPINPRSRPELLWDPS